MIPVCRSMDSSYPYQRNQSPYPPFYYPGFEPNLPQMNMNAPKSPFPCEHPWNHGGCCGHYPTPMNVCCAHNNNFHGCYNYRPQHYHHHAPFPSSPMYYSGYQEPFFVPYAPQPHYTMELPRYDYEKHMPRDFHCCGCPNHPCHPKEEKSVKIEEEEPDNAGNKVNSDDALAPIQKRNYPYPYPIVWIPPEHTRMTKREANDDSKAEAKGEQDQISHDRKPSSPMNSQEPRNWNGWLPFDMNHMPKKVLEGDGRRNKNLESENNVRVHDDGKRMNNKNQSENQRSEFPFPIFWMPYYNKQEEGGKENNQESHSSPRRIEEVPHTFKAILVNPKADEGVRNGTILNPVESIDRSGSDETKKVTNEKMIPVKEVELHQGRNNSNESAKRERIIPVKQIEENVAKKESHEGVEKQSASPRKNGKLPPVCLRVDPLPRKKNGKSSNGSSRSPSPPASKEHSKVASEKASQAHSAGVSDKVQLNSEVKSVPKRSEEVKPKEVNVPVSEIKSYDKVAQLDSGLPNAPNVSKETQPKVETIQVTENKTDGDKVAIENCSVGETEEKMAQKGAENMMEEASKPNEAKDSSKPTGEGGKERRALSDADAAILIQAAYRGYQVRRSEPLKKLKQIAEVSKELTHVKGCIQAFEHSSDLQNDEKQRIALGENIMRLLLKLDTIQGLHPSFRETRKSLARELTSLQERLDSVMAKRSQQQKHEFIDEKSVEDFTENSQNEQHVKDQEEEKAAVPREDSSVGIDDDMMGKDRIEFQSPLDPALNVAAKTNVEPNEAVGEHNHTTDLSVELEARSELDNTPTVVDNSDTNALRELPVEVIDEDGADWSCKNEGQNEEEKEDTSDIYALKEMPVGVLDEDTTEFVKDDGETKVEHVESLVELPAGVVDEDIAGSGINKDDGTGFSKHGVDHEQEEVEAIVELPVGLLDEDTAASESKENDDGTDIPEGQQQHEDVEPTMELPVELLDEEETIESKSVKLAEDMEHTTELPVGLVDEEGTKESELAKHDEPETVPPAIEEQCSVAVKDIQPEPEQQMEEQEEVQSSEESSDGWLKVEFSKEEELKGDAQRDIEIKHEEETGNEAELPTMESTKSAAELVSDLHREEENKKMFVQQEEQTENEEKLIASQVTSVNNEDTTLSKEVDHVAEHNGKLDNVDAELLEENEKLRNMMNRLLDAGNEQLKVISDLTDRVKDLEKKLARSKKRMKTKRFKPASSSLSKISSKSNPMQHRAIDVAM
ncbi:Large proline-rich protein bag6 [Stylosanthes scabra]|uniref:Large proline-rich protein bag6 n=1 Tax=Stylosanthes scabra TaxID=79078 RepID=A0ABU6UKN9_9FABA|nr:Large proline-rich protein bag6 [Stylosanthes scabra]